MAGATILPVVASNEPKRVIIESGMDTIHGGTDMSFEFEDESRNFKFTADNVRKCQPMYHPVRYSHGIVIPEPEAANDYGKIINITYDN